MQFKWEGVAPVIVTYSGDNPNHGSTRGMWIDMPKDGGSEELYRHEVVHVKQFYAYIVPLIIAWVILGVFVSGSVGAAVFAAGSVGYAVWAMTPWGVLRREAAAYAESARVRVLLGTKRDSAIDSVTETLSNPDAYKVKASKEEIRRLIEKRFDDKRLF